MRTGTTVLVRTRWDVSDAVTARLKALARREPPALSETPALIEPYRAALGAQEFRAGPAFAFPDSLPSEVATVEVGPDNAHLLQGSLASWLADVGKHRPFLAIVREGRAVALCASVRITPFVHCAGVETDPEYRNQGLASRVVAAWASKVRALGATPIYSTSWDNLASRGLARRLGLSLAAVDFQID